MAKTRDITELKYYAKWRGQLDKSGSDWNPARNWELLKELKLPDYPDKNQVASVASLSIEGNRADLNYFIRSKLGQLTPSPGMQQEIQEIDDLINAYQFAQNHELNETNLLEAHRLATNLILTENRGKYRSDPVFVTGKRGVIYTAPEPMVMKEELSKFWAQINQLQYQDLQIDQALYHAVLIHLVFEHLHPFPDGNGRVGRLLEKWFLAQTIGSAAWKISSEAYYAGHKGKYYQNIRLGPTFLDLDYSKCLHFLLLLPTALMLTQKHNSKQND